MEVESVIREVADRILYDPEITKETQRLRAIALGIVGSVYTEMRPAAPGEQPAQSHIHGAAGGEDDDGPPRDYV